ncbi:MAG: hypothetical protein AAGI66_01950 [Cyanobacteria bacterium P01_H01_bin.74]
MNSEMSVPFELIRWESIAKPSLPILQNMLMQQGLLATQVELEKGYKTEEQELEKEKTYVVVSGNLQFAFPGYGSIDLLPGDILSISARIRHHVSTSNAVTLLETN